MGSYGITVERCGECGLFASLDEADWLAPWGTSGVDEPPDPVAICRACCIRERDRYIARALEVGIEHTRRRAWWQPPAWWFEARIIVRGMWRHGHPRPVRHGRVRHELSGTRQVWYCRHCSRPERHPAHDPAESARLHVRHCHFERAVGRNVGRLRIQEWCQCGWTTGPLIPEDDNVKSLTPGRLMREHIDTARGERQRIEFSPYRYVFERLVDGEWVEYDPLEEAA